MRPYLSARRTFFSRTLSLLGVALLWTACSDVLLHPVVSVDSDTGDPPTDEVPTDSDSADSETQSDTGPADTETLSDTGPEDSETQSDTGPADSESEPSDTGSDTTPPDTDPPCPLEFGCYDKSYCDYYRAERHEGSCVEDHHICCDRPAPCTYGICVDVGTDACRDGYTVPAYCDFSTVESVCCVPQDWNPPPCPVMNPDFKCIPGGIPACLGLPLGTPTGFLCESPNEICCYKGHENPTDAF